MLVLTNIWVDGNLLSHSIISSIIIVIVIIVIIIIVIISRNRKYRSTVAYVTT